MSFGDARTVVLVAYIAYFAMIAAIKIQSLPVPVAKSRVGASEVLVLMVTIPGFVVPILWLVTSNFAFANYEVLHPMRLIGGSLCYLTGILVLGCVAWSLGKFWSPTLQLKENHQLVTTGIYRHVRHPMYLGLAVFSVGNVLALPNYIAGQTFLVAMLVLIAFRLGPEEQMLGEEFGEEYEDYRKRTNRLFPGIW
jgi:protein-S-isoprenylcysteine O-methyltransferase Ste14